MTNNFKTFLIIFFLLGSIFLINKDRNIYIDYYKTLTSYCFVFKGSVLENANEKIVASLKSENKIEEKKDIQGKELISELNLLNEKINIYKDILKEDTLKIDDYNDIRKIKIQSLRIKSFLDKNNYFGIKEKIIVKQINSFYKGTLSLREMKIEKEDKKELIVRTGKSIVGITNIPVYKQKYKENTCFFDNMNLIFETIFKKTLNKDYIYSYLHKRTGEMWQNGLYYQGSNGEGYFEPLAIGDYLYNKNKQIYVKESQLIGAIRTGGGFKDKFGNYYESNKNEANDLGKLKSLGIKSIDGNTDGLLELYVENNNPVLMEIPMEVLYPNNSEWKNSGIWHAISVFAIDKKTNELIFSNTLSKKVERISIDKIKSEKNKQYFKYPFHIFLLGETYDKNLFK